MVEKAAVNNGTSEHCFSCCCLGLGLSSLPVTNGWQMGKHSQLFYLTTLLMCYGFLGMPKDRQAKPRSAFCFADKCFKRTLDSLSNNTFQTLELLGDSGNPQSSGLKSKGPKECLLWTPQTLKASSA